jgi:anti-sigma-K factor RskA
MPITETHVTNDDRDNLLLYAAGVLSDDQTVALRKKLAAGSPEEIGAFAEAQAALALLPLALPPATPSVEAKARLLKSLPPQFPTMKLLKDPKPARTRTSSTRWPLLITAAAAVFVITICLSMLFSARSTARDYQDRLRQSQDQLAQAQIALVNQGLTLQVAQTRLASMNQMLGADQLKLVALAVPKPEAEKNARGRILWDKEKKQWLVAVYDLMPPAAGRSYELWLIMPDQKKVSAMVFNTNVEGHAMIHVDLPTGITQIAVVAITDEPSAGSKQPTGQVHLVGNVE